jgi:hypothetical protein
MASIKKRRVRPASAKSDGEPPKPWATAEEPRLLKFRPVSDLRCPDGERLKGFIGG